MILVTFLVLVAFLTPSAFFAKRGTLGVMAAFAWFGLCLYGFTTSTAAWDLYFILGFFSAGATLGMALEAAFMKFGVAGKNYVEDMPPEKEDKESRSDGQYESEIDRLRKEHNLPPSEAKQRNSERRRLGF